MLILQDMSNLMVRVVMVNHLILDYTQITSSHCLQWRKMHFVSIVLCNV